MKLKSLLKDLGPGLVVAATGVGAGDLVAASVGGAHFSYVILWSALLGAILKYALNEGIARWQLASGKSMIEAWKSYFPSWVSYYFFVYLIIWSFIVGAALSGACGLAAHAIFPILSVAQWGIIHAVIALVLVLYFQYKFFERIMKIMIALMFVFVIFTTIISQPDWGLVLKGMVIPAIPKGSIWLILGIIGGVGGSVTLLSYGYWIKERKWDNVSSLPKVKIDLAVAYILTGLFGIAIMITAAQLQPEVMKGNGMVLSLAEKIGETSGQVGKWIFLLGFWGAVFSSMLGVWQGVPFLFADFMRTHQNSNTNPSTSHIELNKQKSYKYSLVFIALAPLVLLFFQKPVWIIIAYAVTGSMFMPFLAFTLFWLNNKKNEVLKNSVFINVLLFLAFALFSLLMGMKLWEFI